MCDLEIERASESEGERESQRARERDLARGARVDDDLRVKSLE